MKPIDFNTFEQIGHSELSQELTQQTLQNIQKVQTPTQTGYMPKPVITPLMQDIMDRQNTLAAENAQKQPPELSQFYLAINGEAKGPYSIAQIKEFLAKGDIDANTLCWKQGFAEWVSLDSNPEFITV